MNEIIYARVPPALKHEVQTYAETAELSVNSAVTVLLGAGLAADSSEEEVTRQLRKKDHELANLRSTLAERDRSLHGLEQQRADLAAAVDGLAGRLEQHVGKCPGCRAPVTGMSVLVEGSCPRCRNSLSSLLAEDSGQLDQTEYLMLVGALGVPLALAIWQARQT